MDTKNQPALSDEAMRHVINNREVLTDDLGMNIAMSVRAFYEPLLRERDARIAALEGALKELQKAVHREASQDGPKFTDVLRDAMDSADAALTPPQSTK